MKTQLRIGLVTTGLCLAGCSADPGALKGSGNDPFLTGGKSGSGRGGASGGGAGGGGLFSGQLMPTPVGGSTGVGSGPPEGACGLKKFGLDRVPAELMIVLDRSGSMRRTADGQPPAGGQTDKWTETTAAIDESVNATQANIFWGLKMFPMPPITQASDPNKCNGETAPSVEPATNDHDAIMSAIRSSAPVIDVGATPTSAAVRTAATYMKARTTTNPKYLLLATDGLPNCGGGNDRSNDVPGAVAAIKNAGLPVFVVGIAVPGTDGNDTLNQMADAGGVPRAGDQHYYSVRNKADLIAALGAITGQIASCSFVLDGDPPDPTTVAVDIDGQRVPQDTTHANGWDFGGNVRTVTLFGGWCDKVKSGGVKDARITFGCPGMVIP